MKKIIITFFIMYFYFLFFEAPIFSIDEKILGDLEIYNLDYNDKYIVIEYKKTQNCVTKDCHYIDFYDKETNTFFPILTNDKKLVNDSMYFPSISDNGKYIVFASRATNITGEKTETCIDIYTDEIKNCSNIYIYNIDKMESFVIKDGSNLLNGDSYVAKISANGSHVVFESSALLTGMIYNSINIFKYNILEKTLEIVSVNQRGIEGDRDSISPSISAEGRYIVFQSRSTNLLSTEIKSFCIDYFTNNYITCSNIFFIDTYNFSIQMISQNSSSPYNDNSGNPMISANGRYVAFESYATNSFYNHNGKSHIILYDVYSKSSKLISYNDNVINNKNNFLDSISKNGKYISYRTNSTNIVGQNRIMNLLIYNASNDKVSIANSSIIHDIKISKIFNDRLIYYDDNKKIYTQAIDTFNPKIEREQTLYVLAAKMYEVKNQIKVFDNLSDGQNIEININDFNSQYKPGEYILKVTAKDEFGNSDSCDIKFIILEEDLEGPIFNDVHEIKILKGSTSLNLLNYIEAYDKVDGKTRIYVVDDGEINLDITGSYKLKVMAKDNSNNISYKEIIVKVYDNYNFNYFYELLVIIILAIVIIFSIIKVK